MITGRNAFVFLGALLLAVALVVACGDDEEEEPDFAPVRAYAGVSLDSFEAAEGEFVFVRDIDPEGPLAEAGLVVVDGDVLLRRVDGEEVRTAEETFAVIERKQPGDLVVFDFERVILEEGWPADGSLPNREPFSLEVTLIEEPLPPGPPFWPRYTTLRWDDQLRIGLLLSEITRPLADHYELESARGVWVYLPVPLIVGLDDPAVDQGDVLLAFAGVRINSLPELQAVVDRTPEDRPVTMRFLRGDDEYEFRLPRLGPNVPGANHLPVDARDRLAAAIERGDLHPDHLSGISSSFRRGDPRPGEATSRHGAITRLTDTSISIEVLATGNEWRLRIDRPPMIGGYGASTLDDLHVGSFVQLFTQDGETAFWIVSRAAPLRAPRRRPVSRGWRG